MWGECWEIKDKIGEKNFRGPEILGGNLRGNFFGKIEILGEMQKKGWKNFFGGSVGGAVNPNKL